MKTPEELKAQVIDESGCCCMCECYHTTVDNPFGCQDAQAKTMLVMELVEYTEQLESTISQVSKALCGKDSATLEELLKVVSQLKSCLAHAEKERDAAVHDIHTVLHNRGIDADCVMCDMKKPDCNWECEKAKWRGVCPENTKEE